MSSSYSESAKQRVSAVRGRTKAPCPILRAFCEGWETSTLNPPTPGPGIKCWEAGAQPFNPPFRPQNSQPRPGNFPAGAVAFKQNHSAKGPVSRILSCAVIPLDAALPRTFISDLPGGFGHCMEQPCGAGPAPSALPAPGARFPPYLVLLRVGFTLPRPLQAGRCALAAPFHPYPGGSPGRTGEPFRQSPDALPKEG